MGRSSSKLVRKEKEENTGLKLRKSTPLVADQSKTVEENAPGALLVVEEDLTSQQSSSWATLGEYLVLAEDQTGLALQEVGYESSTSSFHGDETYDDSGIVSSTEDVLSIEDEVAETN